MGLFRINFYTKALNKGSHSSNPNTKVCQCTGSKEVSDHFGSEVQSVKTRKIFLSKDIVWENNNDLVANDKFNLHKSSDKNIPHKSYKKPKSKDILALQISLIYLHPQGCQKSIMSDCPLEAA